MLVPPTVMESSESPAYLHIYRYYKEMMLNGRIRTGTKLPSIRALSQHLGISRNPVEVAYSHLVAEGYVHNLGRSGYFTVELGLLEPPLAGFTQPSPSCAIRSELLPADAAVFAPGSGVIDFGYDQMDVEHFPLELWKKLTGRILQTAGRDLFTYGDRKGEPRLRALLANYLRQNRGVQCDPSQIVMTAGTQQSILILTALLKRQHAAVGVEAAIHPGIRQIFVRQGLQPNVIPLEHDGLSVSGLTSHKQLRAIYVTPSHQFPHGMTMPAAKRIQLLQWANAVNGIIIEDDYDSEFVHEGRPVAALQALDQEGRVIYLGTFSKALAPAMRMSYMVLPPCLLGDFETEFSYYDQTSSRLTQKTMEWFMELGHLDRHVRRMRKVYRSKRAALIEAIREYFGSRVSLAGGSSGLHVLLNVHRKASVKRLVQEAAECGVIVYPAAEYEVRPSNDEESEGTDNWFLIGFGGLTAEQLRKGIERLAAAWLKTD